MKFLTFNSIKSVIFATLESSTSQKRTKVVYRMDAGSDGNLMPFRVFRILFPRLTMAELNATINKLILVKTCNRSNTEQLNRCSVKIIHNDKCIKCRFFVVPGDGTA